MDLNKFIKEWLPLILAVGTFGGFLYKVFRDKKIDRLQKPTICLKLGKENFVSLENDVHIFLDDNSDKQNLIVAEVLVRNKILNLFYAPFYKKYIPANRITKNRIYLVTFRLEKPLNSFSAKVKSNYGDVSVYFQEVIAKQNELLQRLSQIPKSPQVKYQRNQITDY